MPSRIEVIPHEDVVKVLGLHSNLHWSQITGFSRTYLQRLREGTRKPTPYEWARLVLPALYHKRATEIGKLPPEPIEVFEEERMARALTRAQFAVFLGMSQKGYENAALGIKGIGIAPQRALAWWRAGYDWRNYATMRADDVFRERAERMKRSAKTSKSRN